MKALKKLRPTKGKVREALFNIIRAEIKGASFVDLYAGTGAIGIEALRLGASEVTFVEANSGNAKEISKSLKRLGMSKKASIFNRKVIPFIQIAGVKNKGFDIIFLDPPYHTDEVIRALNAIDRSSILNHNGMVIAEHFVKRQLPEKFGRLQKVKDYRYGDTVLSIYKKIMCDG